MTGGEVLHDDGSGGSPVRFATPTGEPCPRQIRADGSVDGHGHCYGCGACLLIEEEAWPSRDADATATLRR